MSRPEQPTPGEEPLEGPAANPSRMGQLSLLEEPVSDHDGEESDPLLDRVLAIGASPSPIYLGSMVVGSALLIVAASLGFLSWAASGIGVVGLLSTMFRRGSWITLVCGALVIVIAGMDLWPREPTLAEAVASGATQIQDQEVSEEIPEGSLGLRLRDLPDSWNALDEPPKINRGFARSAEPGPLDGFVLRFDEGASIAGAYDPNDDHIYALSASTRLDHEAVRTMYLHLCFMLHPYSQDCIDAYWEQGLEGKEPGDYLGSRHSAEWKIGDQIWRLAIVGNVQEIKVLGEPPS